MFETLPKRVLDSCRDSTVILVLIVVATVLSACASPRQTPEPPPSPAPVPDSSPEPAPAPAPPPEQSQAPTEKGKATYYGARFAGQLTANGEQFDPDKLTAAHRDLPFGTEVRVTNLDNGKQVTVRINDRGPFVPGRIIDLSRGAAERIGMIESGVAQVSLQVLD